MKRLPGMYAASIGTRPFYDWQHYIALIVQKPGALRNGAPFLTMPPALQLLQRHLLKHPGGDRVMAQVLSSIPLHGLDSVPVAVECALESGRPSGEHVLNVLGRLRGIGNQPGHHPHADDAQ